MSRQTSMTNNPGKAYEGLREAADSDVVVSYVAQAALDAGQGVVQGTADNQCTLPAAAGDVTGLPNLGIASYDPSKPNNWPAGVANAYPIGQVVNVLRKGRVWVYVEEAVTPASTPYERHTTGSFTKIGRFRASNDTNTAAAFPRARFVTSAGIGGLALLEINLPG